jgi:signal transduction histidine kinase
MRLSVGAPIIVQGRLWGVATGNWDRERRPPDDTEERMAQFAQLLGTAIANADSLDQLKASRARLVTADDAARRRVVRDLHDGAQQRFVHTIVALKMARQALRGNLEDAEPLVLKALEYATQGNAELRELAHGILPAVLTNGGIVAGVEALVERLDLPIHVDVSAERFDPEVEGNAYYIAAEALTNVAKHARASAAAVSAYVEKRHAARRGTRRRSRRCGSRRSRPPRSRRRATALGGRLEVESPALGGTRVTATLPVSRPSRPAQGSGPCRSAATSSPPRAPARKQTPS